MKTRKLAEKRERISYVESLERRVMLSGEGDVFPPTPEMTGTVFYDRNANRQRDAGEEVLPKATVFIDFNFNERVDEGEAVTTADEAGNYALVTLQGYAITALAPEGWVQLPFGTYGEDVLLWRLDLPLTPKRNITGVVYHDTNNNRVHDAGEAVFANAIVFVDRNSNGLFDADEEN